MFLFALVLVEKNAFMEQLCLTFHAKLVIFFVSNDLHILQTTYITNNKLIINAIYKTK